MLSDNNTEIKLIACLTLGTSITWRYETKHGTYAGNCCLLDKFPLELLSTSCELLNKFPRMEYYDCLLKFARTYSEGGRFKKP